MARRYLVGDVGGNPGWGCGILQSWGCKHLDSAMKLFERRVEISTASDVFVFDRHTGQLIARREKTDPEQDRMFIAMFLRSGPDFYSQNPKE